MQGGDGTRAVVVAAFEQWMRKLPAAPRHGVDLIREIKIDNRTVGRLSSSIEGRRLVWRLAPASPSQPLSLQPLDPATLDAWNPPADLERKSHHVCTCFTCGGRGKSTCELCRGSARVRCDDCKGEGKRWGTTKNGVRRLLNCQSCRGKGDLKCDYCYRGLVNCESCGTAKKLERWLAVDTWSKSVTLSHPPIDFGDEPIERDANVLASATGAILSTPQLPQTLTWTADEWFRVQPQLEPGERIYAQSAQLLDVPSADVTYNVLGHQQTVRFDGLRLRPPATSTDHVFHRRSRWLLLALVATLATIVGFGIWWSSRGPYFTTERPIGFLSTSLAALSLAGFLGYRALWNRTLGRRRRARSWALPAIAPLALTIVCTALSGPSLGRARDHLEHGNLRDADVELAGLGNSDDVINARADVTLAKVASATSCAEALDRGRPIAEALPQHKEVIERANTLALEAAAAAFRSGDNAAVWAALDCASPAFRDSPKVRELRASTALAVANSLKAHGDWDNALKQLRDAQALGSPQAAAATSQLYAEIDSRLDLTVEKLRADKNVSTRVDLEATALELLTHVEQPASADAKALVAQVTTYQTRDKAQLQREQDAARKRQEAIEKQQAILAAQQEARQAAEQRRQEAAERRREAAAAVLNGGLMCNDGTASPSCTCGGSHRGCCSHHGGVAGCM